MDCFSFQCHVSTYVWLLVGYPFLALTHFLVCLISWLLVFTIPVAKMSAKTLHSILFTPPEYIHISEATEVREPKIDQSNSICVWKPLIHFT